jgi:hypothetical protein
MDDIEPTEVMYHGDSKYQKKLSLLHELLLETNSKKNEHYSKFCVLKSLNTKMRIAVNLFNSISVCSIVINFNPDFVVQIVSLISTTISTLISVGVQGYELSSKISHHQTSYLQYTDLHRDFTARLYRNHLQSKDLDGLLTELNSRLGLIEDSSLPIEITP